MKSKYDTNVLPKMILVEAWARNGVTEEKIAKNLGVAYSSFKTYKGLHPALLAALTRGREVVDVEVENALLKKCTGYNATITKHYKIKNVEYDPDTGRRLREVEELVAVQDEVHVPADVKAQTFWLTNRKGEVWRNNPDGKGADEGYGSGIVMLPEMMEDAHGD